MPQPVTLRLAEFANEDGGLCLPYHVDAPGGLREQLSAALAQGPVVLDFAGTDVVTSVCLNTFLGPVYGELPAQTIRERLSIINAGNDVTSLIQRSVPAWIRYFEERR